MPAVVLRSYSLPAFTVIPFKPAFSETIGFLVSAIANNGLGLLPVAAFKVTLPLGFNSLVILIRQLPPSLDLIFSQVILPFFQLISITKPPRAISPFTVPCFHWSGMAGNK